MNSGSHETDIRKIHERNRRYWDETAAEWQQSDSVDDTWRRCPTEPLLAFEGQALETIREFVKPLIGKEVCVVGSGDNFATFALAGLGAKVTSTDISSQRLKIARERAVELGLKIRFVRADAANLGRLADGSFDLICSTNGFFVWIADLKAVFTEISRVLKPRGYYIFYDVHPFQRPWKDQVMPVEMGKSYWDRGPLEPVVDSYEFTWTLADIMNALAEAKLNIRKVVESPPVNSRFWTGLSYGPGKDESLQDWKKNPRAGLPAWLTVAAMK